MESGRVIRVLIAKPGLDGHDAGAKAVAHALRDAGMEVIYTGLHQSPEQIAHAAMQEDVDVVGLSVLSGAHVPLGQKVMEELRRVGLEDTLVLIGGNVPQRDHEELHRFGIQGIFPSYSTFDEIIGFIRENVRPVASTSES